MKNKRGQGLSTSTIILLILAVVVLVVLILGFTIGWNKISPWISRTNVNDIVGVCQTACATQSVYDYCFVERELVDVDKNKFQATCASFSTASQFSKYDVESCNIDCTSPCSEIQIDGEFGVVANPGTNIYDVSSLADEDTCFVPVKSK
ncbi:MAG: hypothetical protein KC516_00480 [Nanoarchaeota archaeon]|nr:hypothetical protein [Nanoarchaeota archaeon]